MNPDAIDSIVECLRRELKHAFLHGQQVTVSMHRGTRLVKNPTQKQWDEHEFDGSFSCHVSIAATKETA